LPGQFQAPLRLLSLRSMSTSIEQPVSAMVDAVDTIITDAPTTDAPMDAGEDNVVDRGGASDSHRSNSSSSSTASVGRDRTLTSAEPSAKPKKTPQQVMTPRRVVTRRLSRMKSGEPMIKPTPSKIPEVDQSEAKPLVGGDTQGTDVVVNTKLADAIAERILRTCNSRTRIHHFVTKLQKRAEDGTAQVHGHPVTKADIDAAARHVQAARAARKARVQKSDGDLDSMNNVDYIVQTIMGKCDTMEGAEKFFAMLTRIVDQDDDNRSGRTFIASELTEARVRCQGHFKEFSAANENVGAQLHSGKSGATSDGDSMSDNESRVDDDFEDAFFESDSDLSAEEDVDEQEPPHVSAHETLEQPPAPVDENYRGDWVGAPAPGNEGFNDFAVAVMARAEIACSPLCSTFDASIACPLPQPHQEATAFLLHPQSPVCRILVDHPTGSGKTREMIDVLNNYFYDPRAKVPIFPKEPVCRNFYAELLRWPSRYRDFFCCQGPQDMVARAARDENWRLKRDYLWDTSCFSDEELRTLCRDMRMVLEMKSWFYMGRMRRAMRDQFVERFPDDPLPAAPLRALRYTSAGGAHSRLNDDNFPVSALFKIGFDKEDQNVYSGKIVIMDEVHNLVRSQTQFGEQLDRLRTLLLSARGLVLAGFTGTPILSEPQEGRQLLDIIKGPGQSLCDEGFISSFPMRPPPLFPVSLPRGVPDAELTPNLRRQFVRKVRLSDETLRKYDEKRAMDMPDRRLRAYCSLCVHFGSLHRGKSGSKARVLENFEECAPKLHAIIKDVAGSDLKSLVLVDRRSGMDILLEQLKVLGSQSSPQFQVATMENVSAFNSIDNLRGEAYRVLVADAATCSEGVSFFGIRRVYLADVPTIPSGLIQSVGRAIRMYGHRGLPVEEQTVTTALYAATFPKWMRSPLGQWAYRAQKMQQTPRDTAKGARSLMRTLKQVGIKELDDLMARLHTFCPRQAQPKLVADVEGEGVGSKKTSTESKFSAEVATQFLESIGLWTEAQLVRASVKSRQTRRHRRATQGPKQHFFVTALQQLHAADSVADAVAKLHMSNLTADEEALQILAARSREFVPALEELRKKAIDRDVLMKLVEDHKDDRENDAGSDGESSVDEFELDDATSGEEDIIKEAPLVLPDGWRTERSGADKQFRRFFVDPSGTVYRTETQAKQAVDAQRRAANVASRLRSKFEAKFNGSGVAVAAPSVVSQTGKAAADRAAALARSLTEGALLQGLKTSDGSGAKRDGAEMIAAGEEPAGIPVPVMKRVKLG